LNVDVNWSTFFFCLYSLVACVFAVGVVVTSNIVRMAIFLVISLGATAGLFFLAGADFVGAMQLMIYVGGTMVLLVFGVMLTAQGPFIKMRTRGGDWILAVGIGGCLLAILLQCAFSVEAWRGGHQEVSVAAINDTAGSRDAAGAEDPRTATRVGMLLLGAATEKLDEEEPARLAGKSGYLLPFEIISVHLLVVLIGSAYLARAKRRRGSDMVLSGVEE